MPGKPSRRRNPVFTYPDMFFDWASRSIGSHDRFLASNTKFRFTANSGFIDLMNGSQVEASWNLEDPISIWAGPNDLLHFGDFTMLFPQGTQGCSPCLTGSTAAKSMPLAPRIGSVLQFCVKVVEYQSPIQNKAIYTGVGLGDIRDCRQGGGSVCQGSLYFNVQHLPLRLRVVEDQEIYSLRFEYPIPYFPFQGTNSQFDCSSNETE